jgi:hypothetical protein
MAVASPLAGQTLRDRLTDLFRFGGCTDAEALLCISNASGQDAQFAFSAALESENERLIGFIGDALGQSVANIPTPATSSGTVVEFTPGGRIETRVLSSGPIYAERAPTLGRGKLLVGVLFSHMTYQQLRGVPIEDLVFNFRHVDIPGTPGFGDPVQENNLLQVRMQLALRTTAASFFVTYGFSSTFDVGVAVPLVYTSLSGASEAQILSFGENSVYSFGGPAEDPKVVDTSFEEASAIGIGDIGVRLKLNTSDRGSGTATLCRATFASRREARRTSTVWVPRRPGSSVWSRRSSAASRHTRTWATSTEATRTRCRITPWWGFSASTTS